MNNDENVKARDALNNAIRRGMGRSARETEHPADQPKEQPKTGKQQLNAALRKAAR